VSSLYRFGVSLERGLIEAFDSFIEEEHYSNRSEAIRDLIRERLALKKWKDGGLVAGAIVMTYDHHKHAFLDKMTHIQHDFLEVIISTQHVHLDHDHCLEILAVKGEATDVQRLYESLKALVGVKHLDFSISSFGVENR
jgi:CopG family transcriptional regulator, nickel-responsive regulator